MAKPITAKFEDLVIEFETETPGTYAKMCGMKGFTMDRTAQVDEVEVPADCDDESLPYSTERQVRALNFSVSGDAVWAQQSHGLFMDWYYSSTTKNIRVQHVMAVAGSTEFEAGPALLTTLRHVREKGQKVNATIEIQFDGTPTRTAKAA